MEGVVCPVLHNIVPEAVVDNTELPQLFTTVTAGADGIAVGAAAPEPFALAQPPTVCFTVYVPRSEERRVGKVCRVLHNKVPEAVDDNTELPQLFTTVTPGVEVIAI